jgi:hypothetical protein
LLPFDLEAPVERLGAGARLEQALDLQPDRGRHLVAREPDEREQVPPERRGDERDARRGRSTTAIIAVVTRARSSLEKPITRSCGSTVSACTSALASWLPGWKPNRPPISARWRRSSGTCSGLVDSAALVHIPAWTDSAATLPPSTSGTMNRSSGTRR